MIASLTDPILPIFAVLFIGYALGRAGMMVPDHARAINRFVFYLAAPSLLVSVVASAEIAAIDWTPVAVYFGAEMLVYAAVFLLMRFAFRRSAAESLLLGMTAVFANHVFFVLPITERFYGEAAAAGMAGLVLLDVAVIFCGTAVLAELLTSEGSGGACRALGLLARNPFVYAPPLGLLIGWLGPLTPAGVWTFLGFNAAAAAPITLFALGVTLSAAPIWPIRLPCWTVSAAKLLVMPALVWAGLTGAEGWPDTTPETMALLVAAGPCGAMPFVIATQYNVPTGTIAKTIFVSTLLSLFTLALLLP